MAAIDDLCGHDLDVMVAERVMGWELRWYDRFYESRDQWSQRSVAGPDAPRASGAKRVASWSGSFVDVDLWRPSTHIADAWLVVERMIAHGFGAAVRYRPGLGWVVGETVAATAPLAISRAALKAHGL